MLLLHNPYFDFNIIIFISIKLPIITYIVYSIKLLLIWLYYNVKHIYRSTCSQSHSGAPKKSVFSLLQAYLELKDVIKIVIA